MRACQPPSRRDTSAARNPSISLQKATLRSRSATVKLTWLKPVTPALPPLSGEFSDIAVGHPAAAALEHMAGDVARPRRIEQEGDARRPLPFGAEPLHRRAPLDGGPVEAAGRRELAHRPVVDIARRDG